MGVMSEISVRATPKYQVERHRTTTLPSMEWMLLILAVGSSPVDSTYISDTMRLFFEVAHI